MPAKARRATSASNVTTLQKAVNNNIRIQSDDGVSPASAAEGTTRRATQNSNRECGTIIAEPQYPGESCELPQRRSGPQSHTRGARSGDVPKPRRPWP